MMGGNRTTSPAPKRAVTVEPPAPRASAIAPSPSVAALVDTARAQLASDPEIALRNLIAAWRATRAPQLAELCERVGRTIERPALREGSQYSMQYEWLDLAAQQDPADIPRLLAALTSGAGKDAAARIEALAWAEDPRVADALAAFVERRPYRGTAGKRPDAAAMARLIALADPRVKRRLPSHPQFADIPDAAPLSDADEQACRGLADALGTQRSGEELLADIYRAPDDNGPREVYADWLSDRGDPRGEFIALQLRGDSAEADKRIRALLREHEKQWLGPVASVTKLRVWERGFLAACKLSGRTRTLRALVDDDRWRTVERLELELSTFVPPGLLASAVFTNVREIRGASLKAASDAIAATMPRLRLLSFTFAEPRDVVGVLAGAPPPSLRTIGLERHAAPEAIAPLWKRPLGAQLRGLEVADAVSELAAWLTALAATTIERLVLWTRGSAVREHGALVATRAARASTWQLSIDATSPTCLWREPGNRLVIDDLRHALATVSPRAIAGIQIALDGSPRERFEAALGPHAVVWR